MEPAKLQFSPQEMKLLTDADWILTKNEILNKIAKLMGGLNQVQKEIIAGLPEDFPAEITTTTPKISRGENYKGLPYLVLDYPRLFIRENIFAIRSMFWWGKTLSITLHLSGRWQRFFNNIILQNHQFLQENDFVIATGNDEWIHDITGSDYISAKGVTKAEIQEMLENKCFFKLALFAPVTAINHAAEVWEDRFSKMMRVITGQK